MFGDQGEVRLLVSSQDLYTRREVYRARFYRDDYFPLKHLTRFLSGALERLVSANTQVADIGCGEQPLRAQIEGLGGIYTGIDIVQNAHNTVDVLANITDVPLGDSTFDVIVCTQVLEHVSDSYGAFKELARLLKPGGQLIITAPLGYPLHEEPYDFVRFTPYQIQECAHRAALRVSELHTAGNELEVIATVLDNMWRRGIKGKPNFFHRRWMTLSRGATNLFVMMAVRVAGRRLPRKYYLENMCILTK